MPPLTVLIKPSSSACNMRCSYCFYRDVAEHREQFGCGFLSAETMEQVIKAAMEFAEGLCCFAFQGGEPTLIGLDFFKRVVELEKKHQKPGVRITNALQTNGLLLDEAWAAFLHDNRFLVGVSLDGPAEIHNLHRPDTAGKDTFNRVLQSVRLLEKHRVEYNILSVVTAKSARSADKLYRFFKKQGFRYLQFIPCLDPLGQPRGSAPHSLTPEAYGDFLVRIFDLWLEDLKKGEYISIRHIDNYVSMLLGERPEACDMTGRCSVQFVVEGDGGIYPCDFYVLDEWRLGTAGEQPFEELLRSDRARAFTEASCRVPEQCRACPYYGLCRNGCRRNRLFTPEGEIDLNYFCPAYRRFFDLRLPALREVAVRIGR